MRVKVGMESDASIKREKKKKDDEKKMEITLSLRLFTTRQPVIIRPFLYQKSVSLLCLNIALCTSKSRILSFSPAFAFPLY